MASVRTRRAVPVVSFVDTAAPVDSVPDKAAGRGVNLLGIAPACAPRVSELCIAESGTWISLLLEVAVTGETTTPERGADGVELRGNVEAVEQQEAREIRAHNP